MANLTVGGVFGVITWCNKLFCGHQMVEALAALTLMWRICGFTTAALLVRCVLVFYKGATSAAMVLIKLSIIACLWVPLTSIIALVIPTLGLWPATGLSQITLEVMRINNGICLL